MGSSRMILGVHWLQDVLFSAVTGPMIAAFCTLVAPGPQLHDGPVWGYLIPVVICGLVTLVNTIISQRDPPAQIIPGVTVKRTNFSTDITDAAIIAGVVGVIYLAERTNRRVHGIGPASLAIIISFAWFKVHDLLVLFLKGYKIEFTDRTKVIHKAPAYMLIAWSAIYCPGVYVELL